MAQADPTLTAHFEAKFAGLFQGNLAREFAEDLARGIAELGYVLPATAGAPFAELSEEDAFADLTSVNEMGSGEYQYYYDEEDGAYLVRYYGDDDNQPGTVTAIGQVAITIIDVSAERLPAA